MLQPIDFVGIDALPSTVAFDYCRDGYLLIPEFWNTSAASPKACLYATPDEAVSPGNYCSFKRYGEDLPLIGVFMGQVLDVTGPKAIFANLSPPALIAIDAEDIEVLHRGQITDEDPEVRDAELMVLFDTPILDPNDYRPSKPHWRPWHGYLH